MDEDFKEFIFDQLSAIPNLHFKKMFGSLGLYSGDKFFGIISCGVLYLKTDEKSRGEYIKAGAKYFKPSEKQHLINYYEIPTPVLEDREKMLEWAETAISI